MPPTSCLGSRRYAVAGLLLAAVLTVWAGPPGFSTSVSAALIRQYVLRFGQAAQERLLDWQRFLNVLGTEAQAERESALLATVNRYFNRVRFLSDYEHWGVEDYWATPDEFIASDGGDCEDFSIAKYYSLKELGVPIARLRITYVKSSKLKQAHMVLAYYSTPQAEPLILDNLDDEVRPASQRPDLVPVYSFNDEDVMIPGRGSIGSPSQIRLWRELTERLEREART
jgi:predicted transglutaminase-like cysteine proteinase